MKNTFLLVAVAFSIFFCISIHAAGPPRQAGRPVRPFCQPDALLIYEDCRICTCKVPGKHATCIGKTCDLRTKSSGYCPQSILRAGSYETCSGNSNALTNHVGTCKTDDDCQGPQLCCFDFCEGARCVNPVPLVGGKPHPGRGYPSLI